MYSQSKLLKTKEESDYRSFLQLNFSKKSFNNEINPLNDND